MIELFGRGRWSALLLNLALAVGCSGQSCNCLGAIPGGFPAADRVPNATQVRVTPTGLDSITSDPAALVGGVLGMQNGGVIEFEPPAACGNDPKICCPDGMPVSPCGPVQIDLSSQQGDAPRLEVIPQQGQSEVNLIVRMRVTTANPIPVHQSGVDCEVSIDSNQGSVESVTVDSTIDLVQDQTAGTTRADITDLQVNDLETADLDIGGGGLCSVIDFGPIKAGVIALVKGQIESLIRDTIAAQLCKPCPSGDVAECGEFADSCDQMTCMEGDQCLQELGLSGRLQAQDVLGSVSVGQLGALDLYQVAGGYADTDDGGISLGLLGGLLPAGTERDRCGPPSTRPAPVSVPVSTAFQGNTNPQTDDPFDVGVGIHESTLDLFAWSAYESGFLCLNIGPRTVSQLNTDTLSIVFPSIVDLTHDGSAQVVLGLRPQSPPEIVLGAGTTSTGPGGETVIDDPLLDVTFSGLDIDFFAMIDDQFIRIMTLTADVELPLNLDVNADGEIQPVLGDVENAFTNLSVKNSEALTESPEELAAKVPLLINVALPVLGNALGGFALPEVAGLKLDIPPGGITSVDGHTFLAIFANLEVAGSSPRVVTEAKLVRADHPDDRTVAARRLEIPARPVELALGGRSERGAELEWAFRVDGGLWSPYTRSRRVTLRRPILALPGEHKVEVRAREVGRPYTTDRSPEVLRVSVDPPATDLDGRPIVGFHGSLPAGGCQCRAGAGTDPRGAAGGLLLFALVCLGLGRRGRSERRRPRGRLRWAAAVAAAAALASLPGCSCGGSKCEGGSCQEGEVPHGPTGRYNDIAAGEGRVVVSAYDQSLGDLVLVEVPDLTYTVVDGVPEDVKPTYKPGTYRGGVSQPGPDVGAWSSIALHQGRARISYQDRDQGVLKYAAERKKKGRFDLHVVDDDTGGGEVGLYSSLAVDGDGIPSIAYMAVGVDDPSGDGRKLSQLRYARASSVSPSSSSDWEVEVVDEELVSCAGLCGDGEACVVDDAGSAPVERCAATESSCGDACTATEACVGGGCLAAVADPPAHELPGGVGLFVNQLRLQDGSVVLVYYDRGLGDLILQKNDGSDWTRQELDASPDTDTGMWASATVGTGGTVHVAYQDAIGDRVLYTTWSDGEVGPVEVIDDGTREGEERTHPVGASLAIFADVSGVGVAYQDGLTSDLLVARRADDGSWSHRALLAGPHLYGFHVHATTAGDQVTISSYFYDRAAFPPGELAISTVP